jgi:hypothetical protein
MERSELIRRLVLNAICDDYENVDQIIFPQVSTDGAKLGLTIVRADVVDALATLISDGLAKAYVLTPDTGSRDLPGMPPLHVVEELFETYFYITQKGMDLHMSDDSWWPFQD